MVMSVYWVGNDQAVVKHCQLRPRMDDRLIVENKINRLWEIDFSLEKDVSLFLLYRKENQNFSYYTVTDVWQI